MPHAILADLVVVGHALFVVFVMTGGWLALRWPGLAWLHVPAALWGAWIEFSNGICPLTPLENEFRARAGETGYEGGFVERYLVGLIYPPGLTREIQVGLGLAVVLVNVLAYTILLRKRGMARRLHTGSADAPAGTGEPGPGRGAVPGDRRQP